MKRGTLNSLVPVRILGLGEASQPWRTLAYAVGVACLFGLGALVVLRLR